MRVISGKFRGRKLKGPSANDMRPTGDRLKEALFNILGTDVCDAVLLDVFAGAGAIGIEALSRGAREVVFIESSAEGSRLIRQNLELCGIGTACRVMQQNAFAAMRSLGRNDFKANIVFLDPPYEWQPYRDLLEIVFKYNLAAEHSRVVVEHHRKAVLPESGAGYQRVRIVRQGDHCLSFYARVSPLISC